MVSGLSAKIKICAPFFQPKIKKDDLLKLVLDALTHVSAYANENMSRLIEEEKEMSREMDKKLRFQERVLHGISSKVDGNPKTFYS